MKKIRKQKKYLRGSKFHFSQEHAFRMLVRILSKKYKIQYASCKI